MATKVLILITFCFFVIQASAQSIDSSHFGASAVSWADYEGWSNFQDLKVHYTRMPVDLPKGVIVDNFFLSQYDSFVGKAQIYDLIMYGIVNPKKNMLNEWATATEFSNNLKSVVERYDGDGVNDMPGLLYPIMNWEICNEIMWGTICDNDTNCQWKDLGKTKYMTFIDSSRLALKDACSGCNLLNGAQVGPPSFAINLNGYSTLKTLIDSLGVNIIDAVSYHNYSENLLADTTMQDFTNMGIQNKTIWVTEADMQDVYKNDTTLSQDENAQMCVKSFIYGFYKGLDKIIFASIRASAFDPAFVKWGSLLEASTGTRRKIFYAYKKMIEKIDYFSSVSTASPHDGNTVFAFQFAVGSKPVYVLWATSNTTVNLNLSSSSVASVTVTNSVPDDTLGNFTFQNLAVSGGTVQVDISAAAVYVEESGITGAVKSVSQYPELRLYPNPCSGRLYIHLEFSQRINRSDTYICRIHNLTGELIRIFEVKNKKGEIIPADFSPGLYFLEVQTKGGVLHKKFQVVK